MQQEYSWLNNMQPGQLNQRITFQKESRNDDEYGGVTMAWVNIGSNPVVWARVVGNSGKETSGADRVEAHSGYTFTIRARADIQENYSIVWMGRRFNIGFSPVLPSQPMYMQIDTDLGVAV